MFLTERSLTLQTPDGYKTRQAMAAAPPFSLWIFCLHTMWHPSQRVLRIDHPLDQE